MTEKKIHESEPSVFPIGTQGLWHGGLHSQGFDDMITPIIDGTIAAVRLNKEPVQIDLAKSITEHEYNNILSPEEQFFYEEEKMPSGKKYVLKEGCAENKEKFSNSFVLLKHSANIPISDKGSQRIDFFTLYANIIPPYGLAEAGTKYLELKSITSLEASELQSAASLKIPFYLRWLFKISGSKLPQQKHSGMKLFEMSHCSMEAKAKDETVFSCTFTNEPGKDIDIAKGNIEITSYEKYFLDKEAVPVYSTELSNPNEEEKKILFTLKKDGTYFSKPNMEGLDTPYPKVRINKGEIAECKQQGWSPTEKGANANQLYQFNLEDKRNADYKIVSLNTFLIKLLSISGLQQFCDLIDGDIEYDPNVIEFTYSEDGIFASIEKFNQAANQRIKSKKIKDVSKKKIILVRSNDNIFSPQNTSRQPQYVFYYKKKKIIPYYDSNNSYAGLDSLEISNKDIVVYSVTSFISPKDTKDQGSYCIEVLPKDNSKMLQQEGMFPCKLNLKGDGYCYVKIKKENLVFGSGSGYLKRGNTFCTETAKGFMVYDTNATGKDNLGNVSPIGNARTVLEEFELVKPQDFFRNPRAGLHAIKHEDTVRYIYLTNIEQIEVQIAVKGRYAEADNAVKAPNEAVTELDYLGYPGKQLGWSCYDVALFTKDNKLLEETDTKKTGHKLHRYIIPQNTKIYSLDKKESAKYYFPNRTILAYTKRTVEGRTAYEVMIKSMELYICYNSNEQFTVDKEYRIGEFNKIIVYNKDIIFNKQEDGTISAAAEQGSNMQDFAEALAKIKTDIEGSKLVYRHISNGSKRFLLKFAEFRNFDFTFWLKAEEIPSGVTDKDGLLEISAADGATFTAYYENPVTGFTFTEKETLPAEVESSSSAEYKDKQNQTYLGFTQNGRDVFYVKQNEAETINLLDWESHFKKIVTGNETDIRCDKKEDIEDFITPPEGTKNPQEYTKRQRRKLICQHPLEFDKSFYTEEKLNERNNKGKTGKDNKES